MEAIKVEEPQFSLNYQRRTKISSSVKPLKVVSLFTGCGGMDIGFEGGFLVNKSSINKKNSIDFIDEQVDEKYIRLKPTKFQTVFANDILIDAKKAWLNFFKNKGYSEDIYHVESIVDLVKMHKNGAEIFPSNVDLVIGGFPCQDFSIAGKRKGFKSHKDHNGKLIVGEASVETRGQLYMWMKEVIDITEPKMFIAENVKGLVNFSNIKEIIQKDFASANGNGYIVLSPKVLHAADYGVPQSRERVFFIGIKKSEINPNIIGELLKDEISPEFSPYPEATHAFTKQSTSLKRPVPLKDIFSGLEEPELTDDPSQKYFSKAKFMGKHCQGQTEINLDGIGPTIRAEHHGNIEFRRLSEINGGKNSEELNKGLKERRLTPRECALIQTFPPDFDLVIPNEKNRFYISASSAYKLIGNAVPPLLAYNLARKIEKIWNIYFQK